MTCLSTLLVLLGPVLLGAGPGGSLVLPESPGLRRLLGRYREEADRNASSRGRRAVRWADREEILQLHNKLRGGVYPTAANMEYMVWDDELERSATHWANECQWDHGPQTLLMSIGQNLAVHWGRYRSPAYHVQAWYDEVKDYTYPYPQECNPWCPDRCSGPMCTHYTQLVWATTARVGCAVHTCPRMSVWGEVWENSVYLVCNYSPKGNWIGEAPYRHGRPCSQCPPSYGGGCKNNLCHLDTQPRPESEDMNEVEKPQRPSLPRPTSRPPAPKPKPTAPRKPSARPAGPKGSTHLAQNVKCETRLRDKCRGATCNRYKCPANCLNKKGNVWGNLFYDALSSICRAAIHYGAIDNSGGLVDVIRTDKFPFFVKATRNRIESLSKQKPNNAFSLVKVEEMSVDCYTTVAEICPFKKASPICPRVFCPTSCKGQPSYWAPVIGNTVYSDSSSICKAAIHAGVIPAEGGYVDVLPLPKKKNYVGVLKNGVQSESKSNTEGGSFRTFAVRE